MAVLLMTLAMGRRTKPAPLELSHCFLRLRLDCATCGQKVQL